MRRMVRAAVVAVAAVDPNNMPLTTNIAPTIPGMSSAIPAIVSRFAICRRCSLACWRHKSLWWAEGAMSRPVETAAHTSVPKKTVCCNWLTLSNRAEKSKQHLDPGQHYPKLLQKLGQLPHQTLVLALLRFLFGQLLCAHATSTGFNARLIYVL